MLSSLLFCSSRRLGQTLAPAVISGWIFLDSSWRSDSVRSLARKAFWLFVLAGSLLSMVGGFSVWDSTTMGGPLARSLTGCGTVSLRLLVSGVHVDELIRFPPKADPIDDPRIWPELFDWGLVRAQVVGWVLGGCPAKISRILLVDDDDSLSYWIDLGWLRHHAWHGGAAPGGGRLDCGSCCWVWKVVGCAARSGTSGDGGSGGGGRPTEWVPSLWVPLAFGSGSSWAWAYGVGFSLLWSFWARLVESEASGGSTSG